MPAVAEDVTVTTNAAVADPQLLVIVYLIVSAPAETAVTTPVDAFTVATEGLTLDHTPPLTESARVADVPKQTVAAPVITPAAGSGSI